MNKNFFIWLLILLIQINANGLQASEGEPSLRNLEKAFYSVFSQPEEFKNSGIFSLLGYNELEIEQISKITPRPARIEISQINETAPGEFKQLVVICHNVHYYNLTIERATFDFPECRIDLAELEKGKIRFIAGTQIKLKTEVSQNDILKVFELFARAKSLSHLKLELKSEKAHLKGRVKRGILVVEFKLNGVTHLADPKKVFFRCSRLLLNGVPMPRNAVNAIFAQINPVFDATKTWLNLNISSIRITKGFVETIATIDSKKG